MSIYAVIGCVAVVVYVCILIGIAVRSTRNTDATSTGKKFYLGTGIGLIVLLFSMMSSSFSTWVIMGCPVTTYNSGFAWLALVVLYQTTMGFTCGYLGPRFWRLRQARNYVTQSDLVVDYFKDNKIRYLMGTAFVLGMVSSCVAQFRAIGTAISVMSEGKISYLAASLFLCVVVAFYSCIGGFMGSALVDCFQGMLFTFVLWGGLLVVLFKIGGLGSLFAGVANVDPNLILFAQPGQASSWTPAAAISFSLISVVGGMVAPGFWQRYYAADSAKTLKKMTIWFPLLIGVGISLTGGLVGLAAHAFEAQGYVIADPSAVYQLLLSTISSPIWSVFVVIAVLAAGMSTISGYTSGSSMIITYDFIHVMKPDVDDVKLRDHGRKVIVILMGLSWVLSLYSTSAVSSLIALAASFYGCALYPVVTIFLWKRGTYAGCLAGQVASLIGVITTHFFIKAPLGIHAGVWGLIAGFAVYFIVSLLTQPVSDEARKEFLRPLKETREYSYTKCD